jgi:hypothetical protein
MAWKHAGLAVLACAACHVAIPPVPSQGGPAWIELTSDHFIVWTDSSPEAGSELIRVMENLHQIIFGVSVFNPTSHAKGFVIALRSQFEVRPYVPEQFVAVAGPPRFPLFQPSIVLSIESLDYDRTVTTHELTHVISYNALAVQPHWFAEGLAGYFETLHLDDDGSFALGAPRDDVLRLLRQPTGFTRVGDLFACTELQCRDPYFYASAWALFAYLTNHRPADLLRYVHRLTELSPELQATAWSEVFPDLPPEKLEGTLTDWIRFGDLTVHRYKIKLKDFTVTRRLLGDSEVYTARALLREQYHPRGPVPDEVSAALAIDQNNVVAQMIRMSHEGRFTLDQARALARAHPDDWRAWLLVGLAAEHGEEAEAARVRVCTLAANAPAKLPDDICPIARPARHAADRR